MGKRSFTEFNENQLAAPPTQGASSSTTSGNAFPQTPSIPPPLAAQPLAAQPLPAGVTGLTGWTPADIPTAVPALPPLANPALSHAVFTHRGTVPGSHGTAAASSPWANYEALEWLGDSYIGMLSTHFIFHTFVLPGVGAADGSGSSGGSSGTGSSRRIGVGVASFLKQLLVQNRTLARYSMLYSFQDRLRLPPEFARGGRQGGSQAKLSEHTKVFGDVFEAYVGALVVGDPEGGFETMARWLKSLWAGEIAGSIRRGWWVDDKASKESVWAQINVSEGGVAVAVGEKDAARAEKQSKTNGSHGESGPTEQQPQEDLDIWKSKDELRRQIALGDVFIRYVTVENDRTKKMKHRDLGVKMFTVEVFMDGWGEKGVFLGRGTAMGVKEAGQKAARAALDNKKRLKVYVEKKKAFLKARDEERGPRGAEQSEEK